MSILIKGCIFVTEFNSIREIRIVALLFYHIYGCMLIDKIQEKEISEHVPLQ